MTVNLDLPDIEIDIPCLVEIHNELKRTQTQLTELKNYVSTQKVWNTALESALKLYGIDISSPPEHRSSLTLPSDSDFFAPIITNIQSGVVNDVQPDRKPHIIRIPQEENEEDTGIIINVRGNVDSVYANCSSNSSSNDLHEVSINNSHDQIFIENSQSCSTILPTTEDMPEEILPDIWQNNSMSTDEQECEIDGLEVSSFEKNGLDITISSHDGETTTNTNNSSYSRTRRSLRKIPKVTSSPYALPTKNGVVIKSLHSHGVQSKSTLNKKSRRKKSRFTTVKKSKVVSRSPGASLVSRNPTPKSSSKLNPGHFIEILPNNNIPGSDIWQNNLMSTDEQQCEIDVLDIRKKPSAKKNKCNYCSLRFMRNQHLIQHVFAKHKDVDPEIGVNMAQSTANDYSDDFQIFPSSSQSKFSVSGDNLIAARPDYPTRKQVDLCTDEIIQSMPEKYLKQLRTQYQSFVDEENRTAYLCIACGTIDFSEQQMLSHIHAQHNSVQPSAATIYICEHCCKTFRTKAFLHFHKGHCKSALSPSTTVNPFEKNNANGSAGVNVEEFDESHSSNVRVNVVRPTFKANKTSGIIGGLGKKRKKRYNGVWAFSETEKILLDDRIENVTNPRPPYVCKICKITINSSRQSARRHVQKVHKQYVEELMLT